MVSPVPAQATLMSRRRILIATSVTIFAVLIAISGILIARALGPHVSEQEATLAAVRQLQQMNSSVTGYTLVSARYDPVPDTIYDDHGNVIGSESHSMARVVTGWSGADCGSPVKRVRNCSCENCTGLLEASSFADSTLA